MFEMLRAALTMRSLYIFGLLLAMLIAWRVISHIRLQNRKITLPDGKTSTLIEARNGSFVGGMGATLAVIGTFVIIATIGGMFAAIGVAIEIGGLLLLFGPLITTLVVIGLVRRGYMENPVFEIESGNIGYVDSGASLWRMYSNVDGMKLQKGATIEDKDLGIDEITINDFVLVPGNNNGELTPFGWILKKYWGVYWRGFGFLNRKVHIIPITKKYVNVDLRANLDPKYWIMGNKDGGDEKKSGDAKFSVVQAGGLRVKFPRPVAIADVKFSDKQEAQMLILVSFRVIVPATPIYTLKGDLMSYLENTALAAFKNVIQQMSSSQFAGESHIEGSDMTMRALRAVNKRLLLMAGVVIEAISVQIYNLSSDREEAAAKAASLAELEGKAALTAQEWTNKKVLSKAETDARAARLLNEASITDATGLADHYVGLGADPNVAATEASTVAKSKRYTTPGSPVTTHVEGGGAPIAIQPSMAPRIEITDRETPLRDKRRK